jgi:hypothetical protein
MAIVQMPFITHIRNKLANVVFYEKDGQKIMRSLPFQPKNPRTEKQMRQRNRMRIMSKLMSQVLPIIKRGYGSSLKNSKVFRHVVSLNMLNAFVENTFEIDPARLLICENEGLRPDSFEISVLGKNKIHITYHAYPRNEEEGSLEMFFLYLDPAGIMIRNSIMSCKYNDQVVDLHLPVAKGPLIHLYACTLDNVELRDGKPRLIVTFCGSVTV